MIFKPFAYRLSHRTATVLLLAFLLLDTVYSFVQHLHLPLDGDMAAIIMPGEHYQQMMRDPLGLAVLDGERYGAPNRFFAHWPMSVYFKYVPIWLQAIANPVDSIYLACALAKTTIQLMIAGILAAYISVGFGWRRWLVAAAMLVPFFQTFGYNLQMGLIEKSITYTFFYPLPLALLLLFFLPFYRAAVLKSNADFTFVQHCLSLCLAMVLPFSGPLVPAIVLLVCPLVVLQGCWKTFGASGVRMAFLSMPKSVWCYFTLISLLSLWSMYVGSFNVENDAASVPALLDRYPALLRGLATLFTQKLGMPLLALAIVGNLILIKKHTLGEADPPVFQMGKWLALFVVAYLLLLPLGGYRSYRSLIVRHDTIMPVTLCLVFFYGLSSFYLLRNLAGKYRQWYAWGLVVFSLMVTAADLPEFQHNACEKAALEAIRHSSETVVRLDSDCPVMGWEEKPTSSDASRLNAQLLKLWGVTDEVRLFYSE